MLFFVFCLRRGRLLSRWREGALGSRLLTRPVLPAAGSLRLHRYISKFSVTLAPPHLPLYCKFVWLELDNTEPSGVFVLGMISCRFSIFFLFFVMYGFHWPLNRLVVFFLFVCSLPCLFLRNGIISITSLIVIIVIIHHHELLWTITNGRSQDRNKLIRAALIYQLSPEYGIMLLVYLPNTAPTTYEDPDKTIKYQR